MRGPEYYTLTREYIDLYKLDDVRVCTARIEGIGMPHISCLIPVTCQVALLLADTFYRAIIEGKFGNVDASWLNQQFADYVGIVKEPRDVGERLMELLNANSTSLTYSYQTEVLIEPVRDRTTLTLERNEYDRWLTGDEMR
jgi:hypothetical protein